MKRRWAIVLILVVAVVASVVPAVSFALGGGGDEEPTGTLDQPPVRSDEGIDPDECNLVHNINACTNEELEAAGVGHPEQDVPWNEALEILNSGHVVMVVQTHSLDVELSLDDGSTVRTKEPGIDEIFNEVTKCGEQCTGIILATE